MEKLARTLLWTALLAPAGALWAHHGNSAYDETARVPMRPGFGVVGRIDNGAFAVTSGTVEPWGLTNMSPAMLVGSPTESLLDLPKTLRAMPLED